MSLDVSVDFTRTTSLVEEGINRTIYKQFVTSSENGIAHQLSLIDKLNLLAEFHLLQDVVL